jgi:hypothetical protein
MSGGFERSSGLAFSFHSASERRVSAARPLQHRFGKPRGLRFGPDGILYCAGRDEVVAFDFASGKCLGAVVRLTRLNGQAVTFFP